MTAAKTHRCKEGRRINGIANEKQKVTISERRTGSFSNERVEWTFTGTKL